MNARNRQPQPSTGTDATPYNAGDEAQVGERKKSAEVREARRLEGLRKIAADPECRLWLLDLLGFCGISRTSFTGNSETFFREGQRNVGLRVQAELVKNHPDAYLAMLKEGEA